MTAMTTVFVVPPNQQPSGTNTNPRSPFSAKEVTDSLTYVWHNISLPSIIDVGLGLGTTVWLYYLVIIPWNLYFLARKTRIDGEESKAADIQVADQDIEEVRSLEKRLLVTALAAHGLSALGVFVIGKLTSGVVVKPSTSLLFLGSAILRPSYEAHKHLRDRIAQIALRVKYPRNDVQELIAKVDTLRNENENRKGEIQSLKQQLENLQRDHSKTASQVQTLTQTVDNNARSVNERCQSIERKIESNQNFYNSKVDQVAKKFDDTVVQLSTDKQMIQGVRQFLQLVKESLLHEERK